MRSRQTACRGRCGCVDWLTACPVTVDECHERGGRVVWVLCVGEGHVGVSCKVGKEAVKGLFVAGTRVMEVCCEG